MTETRWCHILKFCFRGDGDKGIAEISVKDIRRRKVLFFLPSRRTKRIEDKSIGLNVDLAQGGVCEVIWALVKHMSWYRFLAGPILVTYTYVLREKEILHKVGYV